MPRRKLSKKQAKALIDTLFKQAKGVFQKNKQLANKYVKKARKAAMKVKLRLPSKYKRKFCKYCHSYLIPGQNLRVRTQKGKLVYYCQECKHHWRMPYRNKRVVSKK